MNLIINLPDDHIQALAAKATARGLSTEQYALKVIEHDLVPDWLEQSWSTAKEHGLNLLSLEEIDAEIAAARAARTLAKPDSVR